MRRLVLWPCVAVAMVLVVSGRCTAAPIVYTESVVASGSLGGVAFTDALVTVTAVADSDDVVPFDQTHFIQLVQNASLAVNVAGLGDATFTDQTLTYVTHSPAPSVPQIGFWVGTMDRHTSDIFDIDAVGLASFDLKTPTGPWQGVQIGAVVNSAWSTSAGPLVFTQFVDDTATFQATAAVPEPASLVGAATAVLCGLGFAWRRARRVAA